MLRDSMLRVGFSGYYGMRNFGDDLFGAICAETSRLVWNADPEIVGPRIPAVDARYPMLGALPATLYGSTSVLGSGARYASFKLSLGRNSVFVLGGGSVVHSGGSYRRRLMVRERKLRSTQLGAVGVSIGPFFKMADQVSAIDFLRCFSYIAVRDQRSYDSLMEGGLSDTQVFNGRDLAGLLPRLLEARNDLSAERSPTLTTIGVAPCNYRADKNYAAPTAQSHLEALCLALAKLNSERPIIASVFSLNDHPIFGDRKLSDSLAAALDRNGVTVQRSYYTGTDPVGFAKGLSRCDAVVSSRLHGAMASYIQGVPFAIVDYHQKCRDFGIDVGLSKDLILGSGMADDFSALYRVINQLLSHTDGPSVAPDVYSAVALDGFLHAPWSFSQA